MQLEPGQDETAIRAWMVSRVSAIVGRAEAEIDPNASFNALGIDSVEALSLAGELEDALEVTLTPALLYRFPTILDLARALATGNLDEAPAEAEPAVTAAPAGEPVCVVGIGLRFPGAARDPDGFWANLVNGVDASAVVPADRWTEALRLDSNADAPGAVYTNQGAFISGLADFDAAFFEISPREAVRMDPAQRLLLEVTWEALERAGHAPDRLRGSRTGVFVGMMAGSEYGSLEVALSGDACLDDPYFGIGTAASVAAGRLAYTMDLRGPTMTLDTACSSSLVALHLARQSLLRGECDLAVVAGVSAIVHPDTFRQACKMRMLARDGRVKAFDATADGFLLGEGCGVVVLERRADTLARGGVVEAELLGSAINQDGRSNGLTAPNAAAQESVIRAALTDAGLTPGQIGYVEAHGSGTLLGDAIEMDVLQRVFGPGRSAAHPLAVGAVKTNIGHLTGASGIAGLIKTVLAVKHGQVPPNLHLNERNPNVDWGRCPVLLPGELTAWPGAAEPRTAAVSSFGWSGSNAHVVLRQGDPVPTPQATDDEQLLLVSARTEAALAATAAALARHLNAAEAPGLADVAYTTQVGRSALAYRGSVVGTDADAGRVVQALRRLSEHPVSRPVTTGIDIPVGLLLPGTGEQYAGMGHGLYQWEPAFRAAIDTCAEAVAGTLGLDLREVLYSDEARAAAPEHGTLMTGGASQGGPLRERLDVAHAAVFAVDYASAQLWAAFGVAPKALLGYSLGEFVAASLAGVIPVADAVRLVARRAQLIAAVAPGAMVTVALPAAELVPMLDGALSLAADNGPRTSVVSGPAQEMLGLRNRLTRQRVAHRALATDRAMHSAMLAPLREPVAALFDGVALAAPRLPMLSNVTGTWLSAEQATDRDYWAGHMCATVQFAPAVRELAGTVRALVEAGPGQLGSLATQVLLAAGEPAAVSVPTIRSAQDPASDRATVLRSAGALWGGGAGIDLTALRPAAPGRITALPTYPFEHQRFWPVDNRAARDVVPTPVTPKADTIITYRPTWTARTAEQGELRGPFLIFAPDSPAPGSVAERVTAELAQAGPCVTVVPGAEPARLGSGRFQVRPDHPEDYRFLAAELARDALAPRTAVHLWNLTGSVAEPLSAATVRAHQRHGFASLLAAGPALAAIGSGTRIVVVTDHAHAVVAGDVVDPGKSTLSGPNLTLPQEYANIGSRTLDLPGDTDPAELAAAVLTEAGWPDDATAVAVRAGTRYVESFQEITGPSEPPPLRRGGVYLITGGLGHLGLLLAEHLVRGVGAKLILLGRSGLPAEASLPALPAGMPAESIRRIEAVRRLRELGGEVFVGAADVADPTAVAAVLAEAERLFGPLNGVFHAAGHTSADAFAIAADLTAEQCARHFTAKVDGTIALAAVLAGRQLDFCLLQSSMSAVLGGLGFGAYAAANAFQDRMVQAMPASWRSVCWDTWRDTIDEHAAGVLGASLRRYSMATPDALAVLDQLLATGGRRSVVSVGELSGRLRQWAAGRDPLATAATTANTATTAAVTAGPAALFPRPQLAERFVPARSDYERRVVELWRAALGFSEVGIHDNFFDLGGNSLVGMQLVNSVKAEFGVDVSAVALFEAPTVSSMARYLLENAPGPTGTSAAPVAARPVPAVAPRPDLHGEDIAILSMAGRFPGASSIEKFWENLRDGVESIRFFDRAELIEAGVPAAVLDQPDYVLARPVLEDIAAFDAGFFGYTPWEARITDPQHRIFLECVSEALERAGYAPRSYPGEVGVFGGANISTYLRKIYEDPELTGSVNDYQMVISNDKDSLTLTASYKLNLRGPSVAVQTFCSTALVAVHQGVRALQNGECDLVVAGGVSVRVPDLTGYTYQEGGMESPDGHVRTFDADARGALFGDGCAVVVLKPLSRALADGDTVAAVIKGSAINNDGSLKVGFTAPSVRGQAEVVARALATAGVEASSISYIEAHGTATELGDPIEVAALIKAFGPDAGVGYCALGSVKTNVGHLDRAAGTTGLIKAVLSLQHEQLPATLHYRRPNPEINVETSPFYVNDRLRDWKRDPARPRRAGISSLGMGGTNAHVVIEEAPLIEPGTPARQPNVFVLSARTGTALDTMARRLGAYLEANPDADLADVAYTLQVGRDRFTHRLAFVAADAAAARAALAGGDAYRRSERATDRPSVFLLGDRPLAPEFARSLLATQPVFAAAIDECADLAAAVDPRLLTAPLDEKRAIVAGVEPGGPAALPALAVFAGGYALAHLLISWGIRPEALGGRGCGEYVAACLSGALSAAEALGLAVHQGPAGDLSAWAGEHVRPQAAHTPVLSSVTGDWLQADEVADPAYWARRITAPLPWEQVREAATADDPQRLVVDFTEGGWAPMNRVVIGLGAASAVALADALAQFWTAGVAVDWAAVHPAERRLRVPLPTYPFERQRYWIDSTPDGAAALMAATGRGGDPQQRFASAVRENENDFIHVPVWQQIPDASPAATAQNWLLLAGAGDDSSLAAALREKGFRVVEVRPGPGFTRDGRDGFTVRVDARDDHDTLLSMLGDEGFTAERAVFLPEPDAEPERTFAALMALTQAIADAGNTSCRITVVTAGAFDIDGDGRVNPAMATVAGPVKTIGLEYPTITCHHVDVGAGVGDPTARLRAELLADGTESTVVLRGRHRWVRRFRRKDQPFVSADSVLKERGTYLITGGLGGIGLAMAGQLAAELSARLVLTGRDGLPAEDTWDDLLAAERTSPETARRITAVRKLRADGAEVQVVAADVATPEGVRAMLAAARQAYGGLDGVLHAAGVPGTGLLQFKTVAQAGSVLAPKVAATRILRTELAAAGVDLLVLFSSTAALTGGGPGQADYCSANAYLDAVAHTAEPGDGPRTLSVNWCEWQWNAWDVELAGFDPKITEFLRANRARMGLTFEEGWRSLLRALAVGAPQVAISTQNLDELVEVTGQFSIAVLARATRDPGVRHPRPALANPFVPADSEPAATIAAVWADALGLTEVGVHDSFFDLGGNSLIGLDLMVRLRTALDSPTLPPHLLYEAPTVADMAHFLASGGQGGSPTEAAEIEQGRRRGAWRRESATERSRS